MGKVPSRYALCDVRGCPALFNVNHALGISYLVGSFKTLGIYHDNKLADEWIYSVNSNLFVTAPFTCELTVAVLD